MYFLKRFSHAWMSLLCQNICGLATLTSDHHFWAKIDVCFDAFGCVLDLFFTGRASNFPLAVATMLLQIPVGKMRLTKMTIYSHFVQMGSLELAYIICLERFFRINWTSKLPLLNFLCALKAKEAFALGALLRLNSNLVAFRAREVRLERLSQIVSGPAFDWVFPADHLLELVITDGNHN